MTDYKNVSGKVISAKDGEICHQFPTSLLTLLRAQTDLDLASMMDHVHDRLNVIIDAGGTLYAHGQYRGSLLSAGRPDDRFVLRSWSVIYPPGTHGLDHPTPEDSWNLYPGSYSFDDLLQLNRQLLDLNVLLPEERESVGRDTVEALQQRVKALQQRVDELEDHIERLSAPVPSTTSTTNSAT